MTTHMAPGMEIDIALRAFDPPHVPASIDVIHQAEQFGDEIPASEAIDGRSDLRTLP
ncbi:MAG: hypothetical protein Q9N32_05500 [Gammaproteobacteria bacterium]|nr:hypothetical protein [Gammaproteobacteria bacterium]